ncbi:hypothetical protein OHB56_25325 [Streptomyces sp. NBC_01635]|uniref:Uncharacterized protein n=1 Tax=Streptomyces hirsutus TaxID=35620 RepID=A0ABZ1GSQ6_9ACTN|nr:hypothetical protein [Streptomyces hirsutus]WSD08342.1 hypothetical protein OIE73_23180 [Streptomyces hirsutus]WTD76889.1 hypothetical protein OHB56_25325 [Streptomyces sp. NBC_01635]
MNPADVISGFPGVTVFEGVPDAWHWSPAPGLDFAAALSPDGEHLFQVNARDTYDQELVGALLVAARENSSRLLTDGVPLSTLPGFRHPGRGFEVVAAARPGIHRYHEVQQPELQKATWAVFPGYECEFAEPARYFGDDARKSFIKFLNPADLDRGPNPFLRMWWNNTVTKAGTEEPGGILAATSTLYRELELLEGAQGSFVRYENFRGEIYHVEWDARRDALTLQGTSGGGEPRDIESAALLSFAENSLR